MQHLTNLAKAFLENPVAIILLWIMGFLALVVGICLCLAAILFSVRLIVHTWKKKAADLPPFKVSKEGIEILQNTKEIEQKTNDALINFEQRLEEIEGILISPKRILEPEEDL